MTGHDQTDPTNQLDPILTTLVIIIYYDPEPILQEKKRHTLIK